MGSSGGLWDIVVSMLSSWYSKLFLMKKHFSLHITQLKAQGYVFCLVIGIGTLQHSRYSMHGRVTNLRGMKRVVTCSSRDYNTLPLVVIREGIHFYWRRRGVVSANFQSAAANYGEPPDSKFQTVKHITP